MDYTVLNQCINYLQTVSSTIVTTYTAKRELSSFHLHKESHSEIKEVILPQEVTPTYSKIDIDTLLKKKLGEHLVKFANIMEQSFKKEDLSIFYQNIHTLTTYPKKMTLKKQLFSVYTAAYYDSGKNSITVDIDEIENTLSHELLHMASSILPTKESNVEYCGFSQTFPNKSIADGINEGYTEILNNRYFCHDEGLADSYRYNMDVALNLEKIIGQEKMESLYLHADLFGLVKGLKKYATEDEIMEFIASSDYLYHHLDDGKINNNKDRLIRKCLKQVNKFLITSFSHKMNKLSNEGKITVEEETKKIAEFICYIKPNVKSENKIYQVMSEKEIDSLLNIVFIPPISNEQSIKRSI